MQLFTLDDYFQLLVYLKHIMILEVLKILN